VFQRDAAHPAGALAFIATLSGANDEDPWRVEPNVTPDGRFLVFTSSARLTPDDTSLSGAMQVFRYDAQTGELLRISIGEQGFNDNGNRSAPTACTGGNFGCLEDARVVQTQGHVRRDPTMSDDGAYVFFDSPVALTPQALDDVLVGTDGNGNPVYAQNVYEWHAGHVYLISDGRDATQNSGASFGCPPFASVCLLGSDASGANVFFSTTNRLVAQDTDTELDFYDARICTSGDPCITSPPPPASCRGDACQGAATTPPPLPLAASVSFSGAGNLKPGAPAPPAKVSIVKRSVRGFGFQLSVKVSAKGQIAITGAGIKTLRRSVARAGTYSFAVSMTAKARSALKHKHKRTLRLRVGFTPAQGQPASVTIPVTVKR
jgi:hypothetical protein